MSISSSTSNVLVTYEGKIASITLNRPEVLNALDLNTLEELGHRLEEVKNSEALIVILQGSGKGFSSGGDIKGMLSLNNETALPHIMDTIGHVVKTLYTMPKLVISSVHGAAAGLGLSLALAGDYVLVEKDAVVAMNFIGIGLIPDGGGHFFMKKRLGEDRAKQAIWKGQRLSGTEAKALGLVDEVVEEATLASKQLALMLLKQPVGAMIETKKIYAELGKIELEKILEMEKQGQGKMRVSADHLEGIKAFIEKRKPMFRGE